MELYVVYQALLISNVEVSKIIKIVISLKT